MRIISLILLAAASAILAGCKVHASARFGPSWNAEREKRGIRPLAADVIPRVTGLRTMEIWQNRSPAPSYPGWNSKEIVLDGDHLVSETDMFIGPYFESKIDGRIREVIRVKYWYDRPNSSEGPWEVEVKGPDSLVPKDVSLETGRKKLAEWGIAY